MLRILGKAFDSERETGMESFSVSPRLCRGVKGQKRESERYRERDRDRDTLDNS